MLTPCYFMAFGEEEGNLADQFAEWTVEQSCADANGEYSVLASTVLTLYSQD